MNIQKGQLGNNMVILYITNLGNNRSAGLTYSVPAQVSAQAKIDTVKWINFKNVSVKAWEETGCYQTWENSKTFHVNVLEPPFNKPDLLIFESFNIYEHARIARELLKEGIPYIIVPRATLTKGAQKVKHFKKILSNFLFLNSYAKNALAIQYLTEQEYIDSGNKWNNQHIIIPNGVTMRESREVSGNIKRIVFIGRFNVNHKGIDLFIEACGRLKELIQNIGVKIDMYGSRNDGEMGQVKALIQQNHMEGLIYPYDTVFEKEKEEILLNSDVFVMTSRFEGLPMGLLEAMAYSLPCLVTRGTNMADKVSKYNAGWTCETDVESIVVKLKEMFLDDSESVKEKAHQAYKLAETYDWGKLAKDAHEKYTLLIRSKV